MFGGLFEIAFALVDQAKEIMRLHRIGIEFQRFGQERLGFVPVVQGHQGAAAHQFDLPLRDRAGLDLLDQIHRLFGLVEVAEGFGHHHLERCVIWILFKPFVQFFLGLVRFGAG